MSFITADEFRKRQQNKWMTPYEDLVTKVRTLVVQMMDNAEEGIVEVTDIPATYSNDVTLQMFPKWKELRSELALLGFTLNNPEYRYDKDKNDQFYCFTCQFALADQTARKTQN